jgi:hypothetical protein
VRDGRVLDALEIRAGVPFGDVPLVEPDGRGGYWIVARTTRERPAADHYEVAHVSGDRVLDAFAVPSVAFADVPPLSRFRIADGGLYQLTSTRAGLRVVRVSLEGGTK